ncbi:hypothetical protein BDM02DRAFT_3097512 [Thelephora ganbajun]|uniref:Uncharacterized protein n=1 Tax=Thelephora ganbajun TaxID=370292 RepID=A0ACB6ZER0_THEGA|nr:hypothetical protein BDM02DRAFT_3097512 [Thelephora ganbajun]
MSSPHYVYFPIDLLGFHRPRLQLRKHVSQIPVLKQESRRCIRALANYTPRRKNIKYPRERCAAVLVALFVGRKGDLYVLLSKRASTLRTYAGDTALPGGKVDKRDRNAEETARREAFEEIGLATDKSKVPLLCVLEPFLAGNGVLITPVVVLVLDNMLRPVLNTPEVAQLFSHPLASFLSTESPFPQDQSMVEFPYYSYEDTPFHRGSPRKIRLHHFLTGREAGGVKPIFGVTAAIMIRVASIGYGLEPEFLLKAPSQPGMRERVEYASNENKRAQAKAKL